ncbi:hypothetical protein CIHG_00433 [Coccidioides immitis H538.4]|uniref:Cupin domain-containing protein n=1 Tax=Coccidioides immitis H538.4 TaxID=396776 RepID=A0A0J8RCP4_COCIT|nr:hypothetical protein CIHG_00433 [Coccidioides immitis H538.4]
MAERTPKYRQEIQQFSMPWYVLLEPSTPPAGSYPKHTHPESDNQGYEVTS